ncbi:MAG: LysR family transcriptional regulator [Synoicihabitans sp.]
MAKTPPSPADNGCVPHPTMELYQLRTFVAVAREGRLTRAAESLFTSQPAVSAQIKALEEEFGLKLFERSSAGMTPTPAGEALWEQAEQLLNASRDLSAKAAALKGAVSGLLRIGFNTGDHHQSSALVAALAEKHPQLCFDVTHGNSGALLQAVQSRDLDACFYEGTCEDPGIETVLLTHLNLVVVIPTAWAEELERPDWSRLADKPWVFNSPLCSYARYIENITREHNIKPQARFHIDEDRTGLNLVANGQALTLTTTEALASSDMPDCAKITVWPHFSHKMPFSLCYLNSRSNDPAIGAIRDVAQAQINAAARK